MNLATEIDKVAKQHINQKTRDKGPFVHIFALWAVVAWLLTGSWLVAAIPASLAVAHLSCIVNFILTVNRIAAQAKRNYKESLQ